MGNSNLLNICLLRELSDSITPEIESLIKSAEGSIIYVGYKTRDYRVNCRILEKHGIVGNYFADIPNDRAGFSLTQLGKEILRELRRV